MVLSFRLALPGSLRHPAGSPPVPEGSASQCLRLSRFLAVHGSTARLKARPTTERRARVGWEGIIAKNGDSVYVSRRTRDWLKFKCKQEQEFVIGGYTDPRGSRSGFGALLLGYYRGREARVCRQGRDRVRPRPAAASGREARTAGDAGFPFAEEGLPRRGVHWVKPKLVAQIGFTEWTAGGKLRHPRFLGLRDDKRPEDVVREG